MIDGFSIDAAKLREMKVEGPWRNGNRQGPQHRPGERVQGVGI
jgi:hypothetical protein